MQQIQQIHKLRLVIAVRVLHVHNVFLPHERDLVNHPSNSPMPMNKELPHSA